MNAEFDDKNLDGLLKRALLDDLPAEVEAGMRERIASTRASKMKAEGRSAAWARLLTRSAWAVLSILMLVAGILLQGLGSPTPLASRIARLKIEFASAESPRQPGATAELRMAAPEGRPIRLLNDREVTP